MISSSKKQSKERFYSVSALSGLCLLNLNLVQLQSHGQVPVWIIKTPFLLNCHLQELWCNKSIAAYVLTHFFLCINCSFWFWSIFPVCSFLQVVNPFTKYPFSNIIRFSYDEEKSLWKCHSAGTNADTKEVILGYIWFMSLKTVWKKI